MDWTPPPNSYFAILSPGVLVLEYGDFGGQLGPEGRTLISEIHAFRK